MRKDRPVHSRLADCWVYGITMAVLAFTGFGQLPVFKRYYIASIPGLGWSADFYLTLVIHYVGAILLLGFIGYMATEYLASGKRALRITAAGYLRMALLGGLVVTGIFRALKNLPDVDFSPRFTMLVDISHLGFMMVYGVTAALFWSMKARWVEEKIK